MKLAGSHRCLPDFVFPWLVPLFRRVGWLFGVTHVLLVYLGEESNNVPPKLNPWTPEAALHPQFADKAPNRFQLKIPTPSSHISNVSNAL